jgi:hypothetical protein
MRLKETVDRNSEQATSRAVPTPADRTSLVAHAQPAEAMAAGAPAVQPIRTAPPQKRACLQLIAHTARERLPSHDV